MIRDIQLPCFKGELTIQIDVDDGWVGVKTIDIPLETVAHGLGGVSRFGHQTPKGYSVGEHSVRLGWLLRDHGYGPAFEKAAHLHDAPECFGVGDVNTFIKKALQLDRLKCLDTKLVKCMWEWFGCRSQYGLEWDDVEPVVHQFDSWLGHHEAARFGFHVPDHVQFDPKRYAGKGGMALLVGCWSCEKAKEALLWNWSHADGRR